MELIGPYLIGCVLLVVAGAMKAIRPGDTARALGVLAGQRGHRMEFRSLRTAVRVVALGEAGLGLVAAVWPRPGTAALVAASYLAFAAVVAYVRSRGGSLASCGCFGTPDTPATLAHVLIDLALGSAALFVATGAPTAGSILTVLSHQPLHGVPLVMMAAVGAWLTYLSLSVLAALEAVLAAGGAPTRAVPRR